MTTITTTATCNLKDNVEETKKRGSEVTSFTNQEIAYILIYFNLKISFVLFTSFR